jgi:hypothetical protein
VSDTTVLTFPFGPGTSNSARLRAVAPGTATVTATVGGTPLRATVTVLPGS